MNAEKNINIIIIFLRLTLLVAVVLSIFYQSWYNLLFSILIMVLTFLPSWLEKTYKINIPLDFEFATILFIYASLFLGEINNFYKIFWWWDIILHTSSALAFACIGFIILYILFETRKIQTSPIWVVIFSFCFSVSIGVIWEIFEFTVDQTLGFNMQKSGLVDTMWDLISNCFGAFIASLAGYGYLKGNKKSYLNKLIDIFIKTNSRFKKIK